MNTYTAEQIAQRLQEEGYEIRTRTIQYYASLDYIHAETIGKKRKYTDRTIDELRTMLNLKKPGTTLKSASLQLNSMDATQFQQFASYSSVVSPNSLLNGSFHTFGDMVSISFSAECDSQLKENIVETVGKIINQKNREEL